MKSIDKYVLVLVASLALLLAGCGGGSTVQKGDPAPTPVETAKAAFDKAEEGVTAATTDAAMLAAYKALQAAADALVAAQKAAGEDSTATAVRSGEAKAMVASLTQKIADADKKATADAAKAMVKLGKDMYAALAGTEATNTALNNITTASLTTAGLAIDAAGNAGALTTDPASVTLKAGDSAGSLGSWMGMDYAHTNSGTKVKNEARVYTNRSAPTSASFATEYTLTASGADKGYLDTGTNAFDATKAKSDAFEHSGTTTHVIPAKSNAFYVRGTYDGAPGEFRCTGTCTTTNDGEGAPSAMGGTWNFKADAGAMVSRPDANYLYYGWWVSKDKDGVPTAASAFAGIVGDVDGTGTTTGGADLTGSATYAGHATGKFAMNDVLDGTGSGGHFTADANLTATFGSGANAGITGTINNFRVNDGSEDAGWSVSLHKAGWGSDGAISAPTDDNTTTTVNEALGTTWSVNGIAAARSGTWSGQMYDEMPGGPPSGDNNNTPTTVTGTFYSTFGTIGRMVGAFGADKQ